MVKEIDKMRFLDRQDRDNLMCPFQCDLCHFRNVMCTDPTVDKVQDAQIQMAICRAILDSFWAREPSTVNKNMLEARRAVWVSKYLEFPVVMPFRPMGPFPHTFGLTEAVLILERSTDPGRYASSIRFDMMRKMQSMFSNIHHATNSAQEAMVMAKDTRKMTATTCITSGFF